MLHKNVSNQPRLKIISLPEIGILMSAFLAVLFFLYPKDQLQKQVLVEKSNYDLTAIYLTNLIKLNPEDSQLVLTMARTLAQQKKFHLALNLLKILRSDSKQDIRQKAALETLNINNIRLEESKDTRIKEEINRQNALLLKMIAKERFKDLNSSKTLYYAALSSGDKPTAMAFNTNILSLVTGEEQIKWLKNLHYLAHDLNATKIDKEALIFLIKKEKETPYPWINALSALIDKKTESQHLAKELSLEGEALAHFYLMFHHYDKAADIYTKVYQEERNSAKKEKLFLQIIDTYRSNNMAKKAAQIVHRYEDAYLSRPEIAQTMLKVYLEANQAKYARELSLKIMQQKDFK